MTVLSLWTKHRGIAYKVASEFHLPGAEHQDVKQEALIGLWIAARDWDREGAAKFPVFATLVIRRRLATVLRAALRGKHGPLNDSVRTTVREDGEVAIVDTLAGGHDPCEVVVLRETLERLIEALASLTELERTALAVVVLDGRYAGVKQLDNAVWRARTKLRTAVEGPTAA